MKSRIIVCALAASLGLSSLSFAQGWDRDRGDNNRQGYQQREPDRRDGDPRGHQQRDNDRGQRNYDRRDHRDGMGNRGYDSGDYRTDYGNEHYYYGARGPEWRRGGYIPHQYRSRQYVVEDWRGHHLNQPPRGYQWVQVGGDYVMVAIATGIIVQLMLNQ